MNDMSIFDEQRWVMVGLIAGLYVNDINLCRVEIIVWIFVFGDCGVELII